MKKSRTVTGVLGLAASVALIGLGLPARAETDGVMPPMSTATAAYFHAHAAAYASLMAGIAHRPSSALAPTANRVTTPASGTWTAVAKSPISGLCNPLLMTSGAVLFASCNSPYILKLTPDQNGNYATGTWSKLASLPVIGGTQYAPQYHASAVLPDTRIIFEGGEYNGSGSGVWTNLGAIYDPQTNTWAAVAPPAGSSWSEIGDAEATVLANGTFMLASCCADPAADALLNASSLTWTTTGAPKAGFNYQDEQGYELLPTGNVLTADVWTTYPNYGATNAEQYTPSTGVWTSAGNTPSSLIDPCGYWEVGPAVLRTNGTVVGFGANTGCDSPVNPTAVYSVTANSWTAGANVPEVCGSGGTAGCALADAPAALLPDGNILFAASSGFGNPPTHFFEYGATNSITQVSDPLYNADSSGAYYYNFLVLPTGQILMTDFSNTAEIYTESGTPLGGIAPVITTMPTVLTPGKEYAFQGKQLNGRSQGAFYGDDAQMATNYPLVRITNNATGHVFYAETGEFSNMSVAPNVAGKAGFLVPASIETGASSLVVVADGMPSAAIAVTVK